MMTKTGAEWKQERWSVGMRKKCTHNGGFRWDRFPLALAFAERLRSGNAVSQQGTGGPGNCGADLLGGGTAEIFSADISREDEVEALFDAAESRLGFLGGAGE